MLRNRGTYEACMIIMSLSEILRTSMIIISVIFPLSFLSFLKVLSFFLSFFFGFVFGVLLVLLVVLGLWIGCLLIGPCFPPCGTMVLSVSMNHLIIIDLISNAWTIGTGHISYRWVQISCWEWNSPYCRTKTKGLTKLTFAVISTTF